MGGTGTLKGIVAVVLAVLVAMFVYDRWLKKAIA